MPSASLSVQSLCEWGPPSSCAVNRCREACALLVTFFLRTRRCHPVPAGERRVHLKMDS